MTLTITPSTAYLHNNEISATFTDIETPGFISWGDGSTTELKNDTLIYKHIYEFVNEYTISCKSCDFSSLSSVDIVLYREPEIIASVTSQTTTAGCELEIDLEIFSLEQISTVTLYASGSDSYPYEEPQTFWSHLKPQWKFLNDKGEFISKLELSGTPVLQDDVVIGYESNKTIYYVDEMPGEVKLHFTLEIP